jgi:hypothetical protein
MGFEVFAFVKEKRKIARNLFQIPNQKMHSLSIKFLHPSLLKVWDDFNPLSSTNSSKK